MIFIDPFKKTYKVKRLVAQIRSLPRDWASPLDSLEMVESGLNIFVSSNLPNYSDITTQFCDICVLVRFIFWALRCCQFAFAKTVDRKNRGNEHTSASSNGRSATAVTLAISFGNKDYVPYFINMS